VAAAAAGASGDAKKKEEPVKEEKTVEQLKKEGKATDSEIFDAIMNIKPRGWKKKGAKAKPQHPKQDLKKLIKFDEGFNKVEINLDMDKDPPPMKDPPKKVKLSKKVKMDPFRTGESGGAKAAKKADQKKKQREDHEYAKRRRALHDEMMKEITEIFAGKNQLTNDEIWAIKNPVRVPKRGVKNFNKPFRKSHPRPAAKNSSSKAAKGKRVGPKGPKKSSKKAAAAMDMTMATPADGSAISKAQLFKEISDSLGGVGSHNREFSLNLKELDEEIEKNKRELSSRRRLGQRGPSRQTAERRNLRMIAKGERDLFHNAQITQGSQSQEAKNKTDEGKIQEISPDEILAMEEKTLKKKIEIDLKVLAKIQREKNPALGNFHFQIIQINEGQQASEGDEEDEGEEDT